VKRALRKFVDAFPTDVRLEECEFDGLAE